MQLDIDNKSLGRLQQLQEAHLTAVVPDAVAIRPVSSHLENLVRSKEHDHDKDRLW